MLQRAAVMRRYDLPCMVMGHAEILVTAFLNVIVNAIESMETGGGKLWIEIYQVKEEIMVVIKDNGAGMSPETAGRVFEQHYSSKPEGLGLGLYHVKHILEQHNAVFSISSEPGKGTSFFIVLKMRGRNVKPNTCINNRQRSADIFHMIFSPVRNYSTPL
jgi:signal transduction histidine kinase